MREAIHPPRPPKALEPVDLGADGGKRRRGKEEGGGELGAGGEMCLGIDRQKEFPTQLRESLRKICSRSARGRVGRERALTSPSQLVAILVSHFIPSIQSIAGNNHPCTCEGSYCAEPTWKPSHCSKHQVGTKPPLLLEFFSWHIPEWLS